MQTNALKKSTNSSVFWRFFAPDHSTDNLNLRSSGLISLKAILIFLRIFSTSGQIGLKSKALQTSAAIAVRDMPLQFLVILRLHFLDKKEIQPFTHFSILFCLYIVLHNRSSMSSNFLIFYTSGGISLRPTAFLILIFFSRVSSSPFISCSRLMSSCSLKISFVGLSIISGVSRV